MKKLTSLLLCVVLVLSLCSVTAGAAQNVGAEARVAVVNDTVTVVVCTKQAATNARLDVTFDSDCLTYNGYETVFTVHSAKVGTEQVTIGLANSSANPVAAGGELAVLTFKTVGTWEETSVTVTAWGEDISLTVKAGGQRFVDVAPGEWYHDAVEIMAAHGYINGISATHFGPALDMNRASFVTLLGRLDGVGASYAETDFTDVEVESFYSGYVAWAVEKGITTGISQTMFAPAASINRAQMVTFLYRYAQYKGMDVSVGDPAAILGAYSDGEAVCAIDWAAEPFAWAVKNGIINGMEGALNPNGTANRAQVAVMLYRFFFEA